MSYDIESARYAHLQGLTQEEVDLVMLIADLAIREAKEKFYAEEK